MNVLGKKFIYVAENRFSADLVCNSTLLTAISDTTDHLQKVTD